MAHTLRSLSGDKKVKKVDGFRAKLDELILVDGFNVRLEDEETAEHVRAAYEAIKSGESMAPIEVWVCPETGRMEVVEGHCRVKAYRQIQAEDPGFDSWVSVKEFKGDMVDRKIRIGTSNSQKALRPLEWAKLYTDLIELGLSRQEIADRMRKSVAHVDQMLILAKADRKVTEAIIAGAISSTEAVKLVRAHGDNAAAELEKLQEVAKEVGRTKVTNKVARAAAPKGETKSGTKPEKKPTVTVSQIMQAVRALVNSLSETSRNACERPIRSHIPVDSLLMADLIELERQHAEEVAALDADKQMGVGGVK